MSSANIAPDIFSDKFRTQHPFTFLKNPGDRVSGWLTSIRTRTFVAPFDTSGDTIEYVYTLKQADGTYTNVAGRSHYMDPETKQKYKVFKANQNPLHLEATIGMFVGIEFVGKEKTKAGKEFNRFDVFLDSTVNEEIASQAQAQSAATEAPTTNGVTPPAAVEGMPF